MRRAPLAAVLTLVLMGCGKDATDGPQTRVATPTPDAATLFVAPYGSDGGPCTKDLPCRSFEEAYQAATPGDVVEVAAGDYGAQTIPPVPNRSGPAVKIRPGPGAVTLQDLTITGDWVKVSGMQVGDVAIDAGDRTVSNVTLVKLEGRRLWANNVRRLTVRDGSFGGVVDETPVKVGSSPSSHDVTFDGVYFHDARPERPAAHLECVMALDVQGLTVRRSRFRNCGYFGLLVSHLFGTSPRDVLIEGNVFEPTYQWNGDPAPYSMLVGKLEGPPQRFVFRDNTFVTEPALLPERFVDSSMVGNVGVGAGCKPGIEYRDNLWTQLTCGPTDTQDPGALRHDAASPE